MTDYSLQIEIDQSGLETISATNKSVALLQPQQNATYQIVAALPPASSTINVTWTDAVSVYVSLYSLSAYSILQINSQGTALSGQAFSYDGSVISQTGTVSLPETIQLSNGSGGTVTSGLARTFEVNSNPQALAITSASSLLNNSLGSFQISGQILLTLLGGAQVGMALPSQTIPGMQVQSLKKPTPILVTVQPPLILDFTASNASQTVHFDDQKGYFVAGGLT